MSHLQQQEQQQHNEEDTQPLLPSSAPSGPQSSDADTSSSMVAVKRNSLLSAPALSVQILAFIFVALIWSLVLNNLPGGLFSLPLFGYHPLLQSLGLVLLAQSILVLQPTSQSKPNEKKSAFNVHQVVNLILVLPVFTAGASIMWYLHHPSQHFISWHGILGTTVVAWMWAQAAIGAATVWGKGQLLGGEARAKSLWKWHRLSGYILLPAFLL